jgi:hypothetical protein
MTLPFRPRWVYDDGSAVDFSMTLPQLPWDFGSRGIGGSDVAGSGVPASYEIRRDYLLHLTLRFTEAEWTNVERLVRHLQRNGSATLYPDQLQGTTHTVYGELPVMGDEIRPRRSAEPSTLELDVTVRRTTQTVFTDAFF